MRLTQGDHVLPGHHVGIHAGFLPQRNSIQAQDLRLIVTARFDRGGVHVEDQRSAPLCACICNYESREHIERIEKISGSCWCKGKGKGHVSWSCHKPDVIRAGEDMNYSEGHAKQDQANDA